MISAKYYRFPFFNNVYRHSKTLSGIGFKQETAASQIHFSHYLCASINCSYVCRFYYHVGHLVATLYADP